MRSKLFPRQKPSDAFGDGWRDYQSRLKKQDALQRSLRRIPFFALICVLLLGAGHGIFFLADAVLNIPSMLATRSKNPPQPPTTEPSLLADKSIDKQDLREIFARLPVASTSEKTFDLTDGDTVYQIHSSIDPDLQDYILQHIDRKNSKQFGFVAMEPHTGRIVSMVSYDRNHPEANICTTPDFPAASLFKIITAAAAIEKCGFSPNTPVTFNDNKYTLYKVQLKERVNKYTNRISFAESFADSVNPVFGKIGLNRLGKPLLETYAAAFGFNTRFDFEIPLDPSTLIVKDEPYHWAEVASGFNRQTLISPLHGALLMAGILNNGQLVEPTVIDAIHKGDQMIYHRQDRKVADIIAPSTAKALKELMHETVVSGTASKSFAKFQKDNVLSRLNLGGKTGSINNNAEHLKYDWFAGFAEEKNGKNKLVVAVLVVHQDYIGIRAASYSRMAIKEYFENDYARLDTNREKDAPRQSAAL